MNFIDYDSNDLIDFYMQNGIEFDEKRGYFGKDIQSFALVQNNKIIGAVSISIYKNKSFIEALAVDKQYRNKGIGKKLLNKAINELEKPIYTISKADNFFINNNFVYDDTDLIDKECKTCEEYLKTCFPNVVVYK